MTTEAMSGPLTGIRVLELADEKGEYCGKLLADLGADVIKIEPPGGGKTRAVGPFLDDAPHPERSLSFWHYNTSKRGITLDLESAGGRSVFRRLVPSATVVLETGPPGYMASLGLGYDDLRELNPGLAMCSLTPFGQTGPWRDYRTSDLLHLAAGGQMGACGYDPEDVLDAPPIAPGGGNAWHIAGHYACIAILAALHYRHASGDGQYLDVSIHEACALTTETVIPIYMYTGKVVQRHTGRHASAGPSISTQLPAGDGGWVQLTSTAALSTPERLRKLAEWMDSYGMAQDLLNNIYLDMDVIQETAAHIYDVLTDFVAHMTREDAWRGGQDQGYPWGSVRVIDEIVNDLHLKDRGFFVDVEHPELERTFTYPGPPAIYGDSPWGISRRAPLIGEHNREVLADELGMSADDLAALTEAGDA